MKTNNLKLIIALIVIMIVSCDEPETVVTNIVHRDGSVFRKIEMRSSKNNIDSSARQVPFDNSWTIKDSIEINQKGDTTWVKRAEKLFMTTEEINLCYNADTGINKIASRHTGFSNKFRWFNTLFRFSETIDKKMANGYPVKDFLNDGELRYFYSPSQLKNEKDNGPDSLIFKAMNKSISSKTDRWLIKNLVSGWIVNFSKLSNEKDGTGISFESLKSREDDLVKVVDLNNEKFDSLWKSGIILKEMIGEENALKYKSEADSAINLVTSDIFNDFKDYSVKTMMPGKLTGTNGFIDSSNVILWPVKSDYFITDTYEMWAESKVPNIWAWLVSGLFLVFVFSGLVIKIKKKG